MSLTLSCFTSTGKVRQENQDACALPVEGIDTARWGTLLAAADGVGGVAGGAAASQSAVWLLHALYYAQVGHPEASERLRDCFEMVNTLNRFGGRMGLTTLVAAAIKDDWLWVANVGDSRAYLIEAAGGTRRQLTEDHSSQVLARKQRTAAGAGDDSSYLRITRSEITRAIGMNERVEVDTYRYSWAVGDVLVLCSDGLAALPEAEMVHLALTRSPEQAARMMVERAVELDGSDNTTVVLARRMPLEGGATQ